jgi:tRNA-splicing ligase RtcB
MKRLTEFPDVRTWLVEPLTEPVERSLIRLASVTDVVRMAVMPDVHLAPDVCVGVALATSTRIYPAAVGSDIGCGMLAVRFRAASDLIHHETVAARLLAGLYQRIPSLKHASPSAPHTLPDELMRRPLSHPALEKRKLRDARWQLGTLGRGNHFLEFQSDEAGQLWLMIHSGSRGMGQAITTHHERVARNHAGDLDAVMTTKATENLVGLNPDLPLGQAYVNDQEWAREYAQANRLAMLESVCELFSELFQIEHDGDSLIHADHNHVQRDNCFGQEVWMHRKGSQSAKAGEAGLIPGSMGTISCHVEGRGCPESLKSSSHGAGRRLSRTEAARSIPVSQLRRELRSVWFDETQAVAFREEAPSAYRDLREVMAAQQELTKTVRTLRPILSFKA